MAWLDCPYLGAAVELTDERLAHILRNHADLVVAGEDLIRQVLTDPDEVRRDPRYEKTTRLLSKWFPGVLQGKNVVVGVVSDPPPPEAPGPRHWIVTAYLARELTQGVTEWMKA